MFSRGGGGGEEWEGAIPAIQAEKARTRRALRRRLSCIHVFLWGRPAPSQLPCWELAGQASARSAWHQRHQGRETSQPCLSSKALRTAAPAEGETAILGPGNIRAPNPLVLGGHTPALGLGHSPGPSLYSGSVRLASLNMVRLKFPSRWRTGSGSSMAWFLHRLRLGVRFPRQPGAPGAQARSRTAQPAERELWAWGLEAREGLGKSRSCGEPWPDAIGQTPVVSPNILKTSRNNNKWPGFGLW